MTSSQFSVHSSQFTFLGVAEGIGAFPKPQKFSLVVGVAEGKTKLTAFDKALLVAGIGNLNLIKLSSILPPRISYEDRLDIPPGSLVPTAYSSIISDKPGELIAAAIGIGMASEDDYGVIMEFSGRNSKKEAEDRIRDMLYEAFENRHLPLNNIWIKAVEHRVKKVGCVIAAVPLWY
jgi:arginine decarboxylase